MAVRSASALGALGPGAITAIGYYEDTISGTSYPLGFSPDGKFLQVFLNGQIQLEGNSSVSGSTLTLVGLTVGDFTPGNIQVYGSHA